MEMNKEKNFISAVIYVHNQEKSIYDFLLQVHQELKKHFDKFEIICVNDSSTDQSIAEIQRFAKEYQEGIVSCIHMSFYQGLEFSMNAGIDLAIGDFVYEFDLPVLDYDTDLIKKVYDHSLKGYDIVSAAPEGNVKWTSKIFYTVFNTTANTQYPLQTETFRILSRRGINRVHSMSRTIPYRKAVYSNCGLKTDVMLYQRKNNISCQGDKENHKMRWRVASDALLLYTELGYRFSIIFTFLMIGAAFFSGVYTIAIYASGKPIEGWTTTMLLLSVAFSGIFIVFSVVVKYLSLILNLLFTRQKYVIESIDKYNG